MTDLVAVVRARLVAGSMIRRTLPDGGRLHVDRPLPFLCVYRPPDAPDPGTADLVRTQASYLITNDDALVTGVARVLADLCGGCLVVELAAGDDRSRFRIRASDQLATTVEALATALRAVAVADIPLEVELAPEPVGPPTDAGAGVLRIAIDVPPIYRSPTGVYPTVARALARELTVALQRAFFEFARVQTKMSPAHFHMLGRRRFVRAVRAADVALAEIDASFDFLLAVTPVNTDAAWQEFCASHRTITPTLHYRMLELDPALGKRQLYAVPLDHLEDPVLAQLLHDKRRELDHQLGLLEDRDTPRFLYGSLQLYGEVEDELLGEALAILRDTPAATSPDGSDGARCDAAGFAARARAELDHYRRELPTLATTISIRDDIGSLVVSHGNMLIPSTLDVPGRRVEALLQHELGTHVVTYLNGCAQPLRVLASGLAGYEALQEGLAMFVEFLVGGLDVDRLRLIAARVVAVRRFVERVAFPRIVAELVDEHRLAPRTAFTVALRVARGGGLTKDAIYLRGLRQLLAYLRAGNPLAPLLVGKLALDQIPLIEELLRREVLRPAVVEPRWLAAPGAAARLSRAAAGMRTIDLPEQRP